jgi:hypothetical protein
LPSAKLIRAFLNAGVMENGLVSPSVEGTIRDEREDDFAAISRLLQRLLPSLAGHDAALGIEIEEDVVPAILRKPSRGPRRPCRCWRSNG